MGIFSKISQQKVFETSKYFTEGLYLVNIEKVKLIEGGRKGDSIVVEAEVLGIESNEEEAPNVGSLCAQIMKIDGDYGLSDFIRFLCSVYACEQKEKDDEEWEGIAKAIIENNALKGLPMMLEAFVKPTKAGNPFTHHKWLRVATTEDFARFNAPLPE